MRLFYISLLAVILVNVTSASGRSIAILKEMKALETAITAFRYDYAAYPPATNWFEELTGGSNATINTNNFIYFECEPGSTNFVDLWGNPYGYTFPGVHIPAGFDLWSMGPDGKSKTGGNDRDDVANWKPYVDPRPTFIPNELVSLSMFGFATVLVILMMFRSERKQ